VRVRSEVRAKKRKSEEPKRRVERVRIYRKRTSPLKDERKSKSELANLNGIVKGGRRDPRVKGKEGGLKKVGECYPTKVRRRKHEWVFKSVA